MSTYGIYQQEKVSSTYFFLFRSCYNLSIMKQPINIVGAGLAGTEAAYYLANHQIPVRLFEMRPQKMTPAHHSEKFAELVCSNSLKSKSLDNACGLLKEEMRILGSITMEAAAKSEVPSGNALAVDRDQFSQYIDSKIRNHPLIEVVNEEVKTIPNGITIIASGPLTSDELAKNIQKLIGQDMLAFFDASAPIVEKDSLDLDILYRKSRYDQDEGSYLNSAMNEEQYRLFYHELINAKKAPIHDFDAQYFSGCMPIEVMASRGEDTIRFGPLKPKGLRRTVDDHPYAVIQLRQDNAVDTLYNLVGFQTNLTYGEQERVFRLIPGLANARFVRYGLMHRNSYLKAPAVLNHNLSLKAQDNVFIAGQLSGVEGYVESAAMGILAAIFAKAKYEGKNIPDPPIKSVIGALNYYLHFASIKDFAPMNANFGIIYGATKNNRQATIDDALKLIQEWKSLL